MNRPQDIHGKSVEMGPWYWAKSRTGKIIGTGKFAAAIGSDECVWFINGTGYGPENFTFVRVVDDPEKDFTPSPGSTPEPVRRLCERCGLPIEPEQSCQYCAPYIPTGHYIREDLDGELPIVNDNTARSLTCATCGEVSTNPGQFVNDGRWVCTNQCRKELITLDSYDDLAASGGIADAP